MVLRTTILSNGKGLFGPTNWNDQTSQRGPPSKLVPNILVGPNQNGPFHLFWCTNQYFRNFGLNGKCPWLHPFFLLINLLLSVFKKLFQCYIQEGKHKAVVIGPRASTYSVFPQQSWKINRYKKPNSKSGAVFSSVHDSSCPWCPPVLQCNYLIIYNCFGCDRYYAVGEVVVTSKEELAIAQQSLIEV